MRKEKRESSMTELKTASVPCQITADRLEILKLLAEYRSLNTNQIQSVLQMKVGYKSLRRVQSDLAALRGAGMIRSFLISPEKGVRSEYGWLLLKPGARQIDLDIQYGSHYRREPSRERIVQTDREIELEKAVASRPGWQLLRPKLYNRIQPLPDRTRQFEKLAEALTSRIYFESGRWPVGGTEGSHILSIPVKANDYVAYSLPRLSPGFALSTSSITGQGQGRAVKPTSADSNNGPEWISEHAVVFIPCPPSATEKFWQSRSREYQQLASRLLVFGVFENEEKALFYKPLLKKEVLRVTTLNRVATILDGVWKL
jgi:hypothetical protein